MFVTTSNKEFCLFFGSFWQMIMNSILIRVFRLQVFQVPLSVLFVFPVQALTDTFNYGFSLFSWNIRIYFFFFYPEVITLTVLKFPLIYYVSSLSFFFVKNTFKTSGPTHKNIYIESRKKSSIWKNTFWFKCYVLSSWKSVNIRHRHRCWAADAEGAKPLKNNALV